MVHDAITKLLGYKNGMPFSDYKKLWDYSDEVFKQ